MTTIHVEEVGEYVLIPVKELELLLTLARRSEEVIVEIVNDLHYKADLQLRNPCCNS